MPDNSSDKIEDVAKKLKDTKMSDDAVNKPKGEKKPKKKADKPVEGPLEVSCYDGGVKTLEFPEN